jgi:hypothetical protein
MGSETKQQPTEIQTLILSKERFETLDEAKTWVRDHDFEVTHEGKQPDETESSWRFRQRDPGDFQEGSFRTIELDDGVQAVIGRPKEEKMKTKQQKAVERGNALLAPVDADVGDVASIEFPLNRFRDHASARTFAKNHGLSVLECVSRRDSIAIRCRNEREFVEGTLRREVVGKSKVEVTVGTVKSLNRAVPPADASTEEKREAQRARAEKWGIEASEDKGESLSFPADFPTTEEQYGDPVNLKFPTDTKARAANARVRFKQFASTYEEEKSKAVVHERIVRAELRHGIEPGFDPDDPLDQLLPGDLKDQLSKNALPAGKNVEFAKAGEVWVTKAEEGDDPDSVRMIGIVMKPEVPDSDGIVTSAEEIENANFGFMKDFAISGFMHTKNVSEVVAIIQNAIAPVDFDWPLPDGETKAIAEGTWYQELYTDDPELVDRVRKGRITGLSIGGFAKEVPITEFDGDALRVVVPQSYTPAMKRAIEEAVTKAEGDPALARFVDLRVQEVSLVDAAANEEDFFIVKRRKEMDPSKTEPAAETTPKSPAPETKTETTATPTVPEVPATAATTEEPTIAEQVREGVEAGVKAALEARKSETPETPETTEVPTDQEPEEDPVAVALARVNERLDGIEAEQKRAGVARAVAKGESAPEGTENPTEDEDEPSRWAGTAIGATFGKGKRGGKK